MARALLAFAAVLPCMAAIEGAVFLALHDVHPWTLLLVVAVVVAPARFGVFDD